MQGYFLNVLKPTGMTSHDVVDFVRRQLGDRKAKVGHLGTLDPDAAGVLPLAVGAATRLIPLLPPAAKSYVADVAFGVTSDSDDAAGEVVAGGPVPERLEESLKPLLQRFRGTILQVPPRVSALRRDGKRGYERARQGEEFQFEARPAHYQDVRLLGVSEGHARLGVDCGPGTYIRSLARDVGEDLGCGALLAALVRTRSGPFRLSDSATLEELRGLPEQHRLPWHWPFPRRVVARVETAQREGEEGTVVLMQPPSSGGGCWRLALVKFEDERLQLIHEIQQAPEERRGPAA